MRYIQHRESTEMMQFYLSFRKSSQTVLQLFETFAFLFLSSIKAIKRNQESQEARSVIYLLKRKANLKFKCNLFNGRAFTHLHLISPLMSAYSASVMKLIFAHAVWCITSGDSDVMGIRSALKFARKTEKFTSIVSASENRKCKL